LETTATLQARCALHPDRPAEGACTRCGDYACAACNSVGFDSGVLCTQCAEIMAANRYHVVPVWRFALFCTLTFSIYVLYWFWKTWSVIKRRDGSDIWPVARAFFSGFTYFSLMTDINTHLALRGSRRHLSTVLGIGFLVTTALHRLPSPYNMMSFASFVFLLPAVAAVRELAGEGALSNARWSVRHTVALIAAVPFFLLGLVGLLTAE